MPNDSVGVKGVVIVTLIDEATGVEERYEYENQVTDVGDLYLAGRDVAGIGPNSPAQPPLVNGIKLGTGLTAVAKFGAGAVIVTYITGSNRGFDAGFPNAFNLVPSLGSGNGAQAQYQVTYAAGGAVSGTNLSEVVMVTDAGSDAASAVSQTIARALVGPFTAISVTTKVVVQWNHIHKGT